MKTIELKSTWSKFSFLLAGLLALWGVLTLLIYAIVTFLTPTIALIVFATIVLGGSALLIAKLTPVIKIGKEKSE